MESINNKKNNNNYGFTLLEMTIALGVFVILFTLTLGIYAYSLRAEQRTLQMSKLQEEGQLLTEVMAKKIRSSRINYDFYPSSTVDTNGEGLLALLDKSDNQTVFYFDSANTTITVCTVDCGTASNLNTDNFRAIPSENVSISNLSFYIDPATNPFSLDNPPSSFPKVTIVTELTNIARGQSYSLLVQQTIPQRLAGP